MKLTEEEKQAVIGLTQDRRWMIVKQLLLNHIENLKNIENINTGKDISLQVQGNLLGISGLRNFLKEINLLNSRLVVKNKKYK